MKNYHIFEVFKEARFFIVSTPTSCRFLKIWSCLVVSYRTVSYKTKLRVEFGLENACCSFLVEELKDWCENQTLYVHTTTYLWKNRIFMWFVDAADCGLQFLVWNRRREQAETITKKTIGKFNNELQHLTVARIIFPKKIPLPMCLVPSLQKKLNLKMLWSCHASRMTKM